MLPCRKRHAPIALFKPTPKPIWSTEQEDAQWPSDENCENDDRVETGKQSTKYGFTTAHQNVTCWEKSGDVGRLTLQRHYRPSVAN